MRGFRFSIGSALLGLVLASQASAQQPVTTGPLVKEGATEKISAHVHVIPDFSVPGVPNVGIIVGSRATLVVDTGMGRQNGTLKSGITCTCAEIFSVAPSFTSGPVVTRPRSTPAMDS